MGGEIRMRDIGEATGWTIGGVTGMLCIVVIILEGCRIDRNVDSEAIAAGLEQRVIHNPYRNTSSTIWVKIGTGQIKLEVIE
jgi:hypothetical protein